MEEFLNYFKKNTMVNIKITFSNASILNELIHYLKFPYNNPIMFTHVYIYEKIPKNKCVVTLK